MQTYVVGGAVRDVWLGIKPSDIDYVVTGATPEEMIALGHTQVGASFPVFLKEGVEYALARTERKTGVGYHGFETDHNPTVTIEDDLARRDLTMNSMAVKVEDWHAYQTTRSPGFVIDPWGGMISLRTGELKHTSDAFAEDPVRILRLARFFARYQHLGFYRSIAPNTIELARKIAPELVHINSNRFWLEFSKCANVNAPAMLDTMVDVLRQCDVHKVPGFEVFDRAVMPAINLRVLPHPALTSPSEHILIASTFAAATPEECDRLGLTIEVQNTIRAFQQTAVILHGFKDFNSRSRVLSLHKFRYLSPGGGQLQNVVEMMVYLRIDVDWVAIVGCLATIKLIDRQAIVNAIPASERSGKRIEQAIIDAEVATLDPNDRHQWDTKHK